MLGVYFILWSLGLAVAVVQNRWTPQEKYQNNQHYILWYELAAYLLSLADYIMRAAQD